MLPTPVALTRRTIASLGAVGLAIGISLAAAQPAAAAVDPGDGHTTTPAQPYLGNPNTSDWLGDYQVSGQPRWAVTFALAAPDEAEALQAPTAIKTKWATTSAQDPKVSYLLWRYGDSPDADEAAALSHLLYSWYSAPQNPGQLDPSNDFRHIAYDAPFHLAKLPPATQSLVTQFDSDAAQFQGPWTVELTAPSDAQIGTASTWTLQVRSAGGSAVPSAPVTVTVTDGTVNGATSAPFTTPADGSPLDLDVTPTGDSPAVTVDLEAPIDSAVARVPVAVDVQIVVSRADNVTSLSRTVAAVATDPATQPGGGGSSDGDDDAALPQVGSDAPRSTGWLGLLLVVTGSCLVWSARPRGAGRHAAR